MSCLIAEYICRSDVLRTRKSPIERRANNMQHFTFYDQPDVSLNCLIGQLKMATMRLSKEQIQEFIRNSIGVMKGISSIHQKTMTTSKYF